jgi:hypothetical protein
MRQNGGTNSHHVDSLDVKYCKKNLKQDVRQLFFSYLRYKSTAFIDEVCETKLKFPSWVLLVPFYRLQSQTITTFNFFKKGNN